MRELTGRYRWVLTVLLAGCTVQQPMVKAPPAPTVEKELAQMSVDAVIWQNTSAEAYRIYQQAYELAHIRLDQNLQKQWPKPPAVVVDVDETLLDNSPYQLDIVARDSVYTPSSWKRWTDRAEAQPLSGALEFTQHAVTHGCEVFYVTNRNDNEKLSTIKNLQELGFPMADEEHVMTRSITSDKTERRANIAATHSIVLLAGDQLTDFDQVFKHRAADRGKGQVDTMRDTLSQYFILLPNPMYGTWRDVLIGKRNEAKQDSISKFFKENMLK